MMLAPPAVPPRRVPVVMVIVVVVVWMPVAVGVIPSVCGSDIGHADDRNGHERQRECSQEMQARSRIARRSGRHAKPPFLKCFSSIRTTARASPHFHGK